MADTRADERVKNALTALRDAGLVTDRNELNRAYTELLAIPTPD